MGTKSGGPATLLFASPTRKSGGAIAPLLPRSMATSNLSWCLFAVDVVTYRITDSAAYVSVLVQCVRRLMPTMEALLSASQQLVCIADQYVNLRITCLSSATEWRGIATIRFVCFHQCNVNTMNATLLSFHFSCCVTCVSQWRRQRDLQCPTTIFS